jgi:hypothetical protein
MIDYPHFSFKLHSVRINHYLLPMKCFAFAFITASAFVCALSCQKDQGIVSHPGAPKISDGLVAGGPPTIIAWLKGPDVPVATGILYGRISPFSFAIGGKGYMGSGVEISNTITGGRDVWQYDTTTRAWTQVANWPGTALSKMASFAIGSNGYVCTGSIFPELVGNPNVKEVWQYDQNTNTWSRKSNFTGGARSGAVAAAIDGKGYLGTGTTAANGANQDWWQYDPATDGWAQKSSLPGPARTDAVAFAPPNANGKVYVSTGYDSPEPSYYNPSSYYNDLWAYNPATDNWARKADLPAAGRGQAVGISLPTAGVVSTGLMACEDCALNDCWEFIPSKGTWFQLPNIGGGIRFDAGSFCIGNTIYIGAGSPPYGTSNIPKNDFWGLTTN